MLVFKFLYDRDGKYFYEYYTEGHMDAPGIVAIKSKGEGRIVSLSKEDPFKNYAFHAIYGIETPEEKTGTIAWY